jgi:hypothetical protein
MVDNKKEGFENLNHQLQNKDSKTKEGMKMNLDDLDRNKIIYKLGSFTFRELSKRDGKDKGRIVEIIKECAIRSTVILYKNFLRAPKRIEENINEDHKHLQHLLFEFKNMKDIFPYNEQSLEREDPFNIISKHIEVAMSPNKLFATFWPIQDPFKDNTVNYIEKAIEARSGKGERKLFRLGIEYEKELIGCFEFDYTEKTICGKKTIGNLGIFIDPKFRNTENEKGEKISSFPDVFSSGALLLDNFFKKPKKLDDLYISASTHPLNFEVRSHIINDSTGFDLIETKTEVKYNMQQRDYYVSKYDVFMKNFLPLAPEPTPI